jgi:hypothetical protein
MNCVRCDAENPISGKFCRSCGATLGIMCRRCATVAHPEDRYCTSCGLSLAERTGGEPAGASRNLSPVASQYSPEEIEGLLALRHTIRRETHAAKTLNQNDVDKLFE